MNPLTILQLLQLGIAIADSGIKVWGEIKGIKDTPQPDGTNLIDISISVRQDKLAAYLTTEQSDLAETVAEIARRKANP